MAAPSHPLSAVCLLPRSGRTSGALSLSTGTPRLANDGEAGPFLVVIPAAQNPFQGLGAKQAKSHKSHSASPALSLNRTTERTDEPSRI